MLRTENYVVWVLIERSELGWEAPKQGMLSWVYVKEQLTKLHMAIKPMSQ